MGGGILILYKSKHSIIEIRNWEHSDFKNLEYLCVDLLPNKKNKEHPYRFFCCYIPPDVSRDMLFLSHFLDCIKKHNTGNPFYLLGDFNMPFIDWKTMSSPSAYGQKFLNFCAKNSLCQLVQEPTTIYDSLLDLLLCDNASARKLCSVEVLPPFYDKGDHFTVEFLLSYNNQNSICSNIPPSLSYHKGNYNAINHELSKIDWPTIFTNNNNRIQPIYDYFLEKVHDLMSQYIPKTTFRKTGRQPSHLKRLAKRKNALFKKTRNNPNLKENYKTISKEYKNAVRLWHNKLENKICNSKNSSAFFKYANKKLKSFESIPPLKMDTGEFITSDHDKATVLNKMFHSVFTGDDGRTLDTECKINQNHFLGNIEITQETILEFLSTLDPKTSQTPDNLPCFVLKQIGETISPFLCLLFSLSFKQTNYPINGNWGL